jgi:hypothetical protein
MHAHFGILQVISDVTWPNICRNLYSNLDRTPYEEQRKLDVKCFAGDWSYLQLLLSGENSGEAIQYLQQFGVIFSAETLYTSESCKQVSRKTLPLAAMLVRCINDTLRILWLYLGSRPAEVS